MARINKKVILDYFGSFFKQYSPIPKELISKIRDIVDDAECGCCSVVTIYWVDNDDSDATPAGIQVIFKDAADAELSSTTITGTSPQRICVPREATQLCVNVITEVADAGLFVVNGTDGFTTSDVGAVGEYCSAIEFPFADVYTVSTEAAP
jgi:hypothetical protein